MKTLKDYSEDIYKCTKCGLCQSVCPVFEATGLETAVSRGKFTLLNGVVNGDIKFGKNMSKYLDLCLGCNACYDFCPSGISVEEIITAARYESCKLNGVGFLKKLIILNLDSKINLMLLKFFLDIYRVLRLDKLSDFTNSFLYHPEITEGPALTESILSSQTLRNDAPQNGKCKIKSFINKMFNSILLFNLQVKENIRYRKLAPAKPKSDLKIAYFPGCINTYINSSVKNAVIMVLEKNGIEVDIPKSLSCCGIPVRSAGDLDNFVKLAKNNLDKISADIDYLITDCASCGSVWQAYADILEGEYKEKAEILASKAVNINKFLILADLYIPENNSINKKVTYHDPCHLKRFQGIFEEPRKILSKIPGIDFIELKESDKCCGAAGTFCATNPEISRAISKRKAENIINSGAEIISTSCPSCNIGISQGLIQSNMQLPVLQPVELLALLYSNQKLDF